MLRYKAVEWPWMSARTSSFPLYSYRKWANADSVCPSLSWRFGWTSVPLYLRTALVRRGSTSQTAESSSKEGREEAGEGVPISRTRKHSETMILYHFNQFGQGCDLWPFVRNSAFGQQVGDRWQQATFGQVLTAPRATVICILFCTINFREHYLVVLQFDIFGQ